jgi:hypothetical protein
MDILVTDGNTTIESNLLKHKIYYRIKSVIELSGYTPIEWETQWANRSTSNKTYSEGITN